MPASHIRLVDLKRRSEEEKLKRRQITVISFIRLLWHNEDLYIDFYVVKMYQLRVAMGYKVRVWFKG